MNIELLDLTNAVFANYLTALTIFFSLVTAYVAAAFVAGKLLNRVQLLIVNFSFLTATSMFGYIAVIIYIRFYALIQAEESIDPPLNLAVPSAVLMLLIVAGSLIFMSSVRKTRT
jgi:hypothetical protein